VILGATGSGLASPVTTVRLSLHVLGATVWVGGQIVLLGLLPTARQLATDGPKRMANAFARLAWPAYALLVITGFWNIAAVHLSEQSTAWKAVLWSKLAIVALAGIATGLHSRATSRGAIAAWGAIAGLSSVVALCMGVLLAGP
jgi:putative copper export protein